MVVQLYDMLCMNDEFIGKKYNCYTSDCKHVHL